MDRSHYLYIIRCSDGSYYVGTTSDLDQRFLAHNQGKTSTYTAARRPALLVYSEKHKSVEAARARERRIKGWTRSKKEALILGDKQRLKRLSKRVDLFESKKPRMNFERYLRTPSGRAFAKNRLQV